MTEAELPPDFDRLFPERVRRRGQEYVDLGRVHEMEIDPDAIRARVDGEVSYWVVLRPTSEETLGTCDCPAFREFGPCKHMYAVALVASRELGGASESTFESPPVVEALAWQERLRAIQSAEPALSSSPLSYLVQGLLKVEYVLNVDESFHRGRPIIQLFKRRQLKDGGWGKRLDYRPEHSTENAPPTDEDLDLLIEIGALLDEDLRFGGARSMTSKFPLAKRTALRTLERMCATGRAFWRDGSEDGPLRFDAEAVWTFELSLERQERSGINSLVVTGKLLREDVAVPLEAATILLEPEMVLVNGVLAAFDPGDSGHWARELSARGPIVVPALQEESLMRELAAVPSGSWSEETDHPGLAAKRMRPQLKLFGDSTWRKGRIECEVSFDYGEGCIAGAHEVSSTVVDPKSGEPVRRSSRSELVAMRQFQSVSGQSNESDRMGRGNASIDNAMRERAIYDLLEAGWFVSVEGSELFLAGDFKANVRSGIDWFDLEGGMEFGSQLATLPELLKALREGRQSVRLPDGSLGMLPAGFMENWGLLDLAGKAEGDAVRFAANQGWLLDALLAARRRVSVDDGFEAYRAKLAAFQSVEPLNEPSSFHGELRPYQRDGLGWFTFLRELGLGGCLADDMGLGKTVQVLALLEGRRRERAEAGEPAVPSLVVAPKSLIFNWIAEAQRFAPEMVVFDHTGTDRGRRFKKALEADLILTTYGTLRRDATKLAKVDFDYVILDEATAIKNATSQASKSARLLNARNRLALSGTPIENHLGELWSLFEFLNPGMLGRSTVFGAFAASRDRKMDVERLSKALRPFFLRRTKSEVLEDLPEKTEQIVKCALAPEERRRYNEVRDHFRAQILGVSGPDAGNNKLQVLEALLRLRQCACHPSLMDDELFDETSAKLDVLLPRLEELVEEGHKVLVFSQFTSFLAVVRDRLDKAGLTYEYLDGKTRKRKERVERFQSDPDCPLFLISLKAGGHGLNLTVADYVFLLDPWWNPAIESQAIDRAHRIGQTKPVFAYRLIAEGTVEEKVLELQDSKRALAEELLSSGSGGVRDLTRADLEVLLS